MILGGDWQELEGKRWPIPSFCAMSTISASGEKKFVMTVSCYQMEECVVRVRGGRVWIVSV